MEDGAVEVRVERIGSSRRIAPVVMTPAAEEQPAFGDSSSLDPLDSWLPITESRNGNFFTITSQMLCSGIGLQALFLPVAFISLGWVWGIICVSLLFVWQLYTIWLLVDLHESPTGTRFSRYLHLAMVAFCAKMGKLAAIFPTMYLSGGTCVLLIINGGGSLQLLYKTIINDDDDKGLTGAEWFLVFVCVAILVALFFPNLNSLASISVVGSLTGVAYCTILWTLSVSKGRPQGVTYDDPPEVSTSKVDRFRDISNALALISLAFRGHNIILEIQCLAGDIAYKSKSSIASPHVERSDGILSTHSIMSFSASHCWVLDLWQLGNYIKASFSSSRTARTGTTKPKESSPPTASYVLSPVKLTREPGPASSWRRPSEIPFQGKAANSVKVIGFVQRPVQFQTLPDGKCVAATVIVQDNREITDSASYVPSFLIPVVFEGDLAHVVGFHVKESDCVHVSGQLSGDNLPFQIDGYGGNFHIVAQDVYFVEGVKGKAASKKNGAKIESEDLGNLADASESEVKKMKNGAKIDSEDLGNLADASETEVKKMKNGESIVSDDSLVGVDNGDQNGLNSSNTSMNPSATGNEDWWDLIRNPNDWWDYRERKSEGKLKARHPDFKHKNKGVALWLNNAPNSVLKGLEGVEFRSKQQVKSEKEEHWKRLVENPDKWWDNRLKKRNEKSPDFKNKESGEALWLNSAPDWAIPKLPPLRDGKVASAAT
nr:lysine histidine transporter-like 8 [Ipomoea batatas]